jgi:carboxypeptidase Taq
VQPSFIRVEADEVTYCLHVILRFEIEQELIRGTLSVSDLPEAWNTKMKEFFKITPPTDRQGCLQDIHWSLGDFGYFPTYALGNMLAAQFFKAFEKKHPDWETRVEAGDFVFIRDFLRDNVHRHGRRYNMEELAKRVTGKPFTEDAYCKYLNNKYLD